MLILLLLIFILMLFTEKNRIYTETDFILKRIENPADNTYYFEIPISFYQFRKREEVRKRYGQNGIIYREEDNSYHRVLKWGANVQGIQRIIAEPYIVEEIIPNNNYNLYISNNGSLYINLTNESYFNGLYQEITNQALDIDEQERDSALNILKDILDKKVMRKKALENLYDFLEKYNVILSYASNVLSIISSIIGIIG